MSGDIRLRNGHSAYRSCCLLYTSIIKIAMINVHKRLTESNMKSRLILQVHDELLIAVSYTHLDVYKRQHYACGVGGSGQTAYGRSNDGRNA